MKTKKNNLFILLSIIILILLIACKCEDNKHECITFVNQSNLEIYVCLDYELINTPSDTFVTCDEVKTIITPNNKFCFSYGVIDRWEDIFNVRPYIQFMVFSKPFVYEDCTEEYLMEFTRKYQLKRYQLTKEDLDRMNWTVVYE